MKYQLTKATDAATKMLAGGRQHLGCIILQAEINSLLLLKMGK